MTHLAAPYYPAPGYYPQAGPGGLPADRASVDTRVYIPAQYEHIQIHPGLGMAVVVVGVVAALMAARSKKAL